MEFLPVLLNMMSKYETIDASDVSILVEKFDDGTSMHIRGKDPRVGDMLADLLVAVAKMAEKEKNPIKIEISNKRD